MVNYKRVWILSLSAYRIRFSSIEGSDLPWGKWIKPRWYLHFLACCYVGNKRGSRQSYFRISSRHSSTSILFYVYAKPVSITHFWPFPRGFEPKFWHGRYQARFNIQDNYKIFVGDCAKQDSSWSLRRIHKVERLSWRFQGGFIGGNKEVCSPAIPVQQQSRQEARYYCMVESTSGFRSCPNPSSEYIYDD